MYDLIAQQISAAATRRQKSAMIHFQVLKYANQLRNVDPVTFCRKVGIEDVWATEFKKMINLSRLLEEEGFELSAASRATR